MGRVVRTWCLVGYPWGMGSLKDIIVSQHGTAAVLGEWKTCVNSLLHQWWYWCQCNWEPISMQEVQIWSPGTQSSSCDCPLQATVQKERSATLAGSKLFYSTVLVCENLSLPMTFWHPALLYSWYVYSLQVVSWEFRPCSRLWNF